MNLKKWIVPVCAGSIFVSVLLESFYTLPLYLPFVCGVFSIVLVGLFLFKKKHIFLFFALGMLVFSFGVFRFHQEKEYRSGVIKTLGVNNKIEGEVLVVSAPDYREKSVKIIGLYKNAKLLITLPVGSPVLYGDNMYIQGDLIVPEPFETDQGRIFNYSGYLAKDRIFFEVRYPKYEILGKGESSFVLKKLYSFKEYIRQKVQYSHTKNEQGLLLGILLGERGGISQFQDAFINTGTIHIVALSGYNVTIISEAIAYTLIPILGVTLGLLGGAVGVVLFAIMTGLGATIVRATVMGLLAYVARMTGKEYDIGRGLLIAGTLMLIFNPWILVYDVSFQLSFIATVGLIYVTPFVYSWFGWIKNRAIKEIVSATVATNISVLPFVAYVMGIVSLVSIPANILIAPLVPLAMLFGSLAVFLFIVFPVLSIPFIALSSLILSIIIGVAQKGNLAPLSHILIPNFSIVVVCIYYAVLVYFIRKHRHKESQAQ